MELNRRKVIVTGFGPFRNYSVNPSWEAVKLLPDLNQQQNDKDMIDIEIKQIPVTYKDVDEKVQLLWEKKPTLMIHVGVSHLAEKITIETIANRSGYLMTDCNGDLHPTGECCNIGHASICCKIDVENMCKEINAMCGNTVVCTSNDAGRYLCEYIFYKSLNVDSNRTMFIHVPPIDNRILPDKLAEIILLIIKTALKQLPLENEENKMSSSNCHKQIVCNNLNII